jgi:predicted phosphodiesterase
MIVFKWLSMNQNPTPDLETVRGFINEILPFMENKPIVRGVKNGPVLYVGDLHGFYQDLLNAFEIAKKNYVNTVIFLGDYADRGPYQLKTLLKVMDAFARSEGYNKQGTLGGYIKEEKYPFKIIALRGNHEDTVINISYGFKDELVYKHGFSEFPDVSLEQLYSNLPIIATTDWKTFAVHGGIPKPKKGEIGSSFLSDLITKRTPLELNSMESRLQIYQALWNDPFIDSSTKEPKFRKSFRGPNIYEFNKVAFEDFLKVNKYSRLVRAHETAIDGYEIHWDYRLIHIFSAAPYFGHVKTAAYFLEYDDGSGKILNGHGNVLKNIEPVM